MRSLEETVRDEITPLIAAMGFAPVDVNVFRHRGACSVKLVIYRPSGVSVEDCAAVSRQVHPRLELLAELGDCSLEVSSPGIGRQLKGPAEYELFQGRGASVLLTEESEWCTGLIDHVDGRFLYVRSGGETAALPLEKIKRVKLAFVKEEENNHVL